MNLAPRAALVPCSRLLADKLRLRLRLSYHGLIRLRNTIEAFKVSGSAGATRLASLFLNEATLID